MWKSYDMKVIIIMKILIVINIGNKAIVMTNNDNVMTK
jgi:hypothetical protein